MGEDLLINFCWNLKGVDFGDLYYFSRKLGRRNWSIGLGLSQIREAMVMFSYSTTELLRCLARWIVGPVSLKTRPFLKN